MTKYIKQYDTYSCAPTAILNALKWAGKRVTLKNKKKYIKVCKAAYAFGGTYLSDFKKALGKLKEIEIIKFTKNLKPQDIKESFKRGESVIVRIFYNDLGRGHIFLIVPGPKKNLIRCINYYQGIAIDDITKRVFYREIKKTSRQYSIGWVIKRKNKGKQNVKKAVV
jgi:hypothetical protein